MQPPTLAKAGQAQHPFELALLLTQTGKFL